MRPEMSSPLYFSTMKSSPFERKKLLQKNTKDGGSTTKESGCSNGLNFLWSLALLLVCILLCFMIIAYMTSSWKKAGSKLVKWVPASHGDIPEHAVVVGAANMTHMAVVIRANYNDGLIPGKLISGATMAFIGIGLYEMPVVDYEVLTDPKGVLCWVPSTQKAMKHAVYGGHRELGSNYTLYVARAWIQGELTPGKQWDQDDTCSVPYGGQETYETCCDILVYC